MEIFNSKILIIKLAYQEFLINIQDKKNADVNNTLFNLEKFFSSLANIDGKINMIIEKDKVKTKIEFDKEKVFLAF